MNKHSCYPVDGVTNKEICLFMGVCTFILNIQFINIVYQMILETEPQIGNGFDGNDNLISTNWQ